MSENHKHPDGPWAKMCDVVVASVPPNADILDLASGPGEPAATIAAALPDSRVVASDVNQDMVDAAEKRSMGLPNLSAALADSQDLSQYADDSFDCVTCCYGYMFPSDKDKALCETIRVLKPGGLLVATTWDNVDIMKVSRHVMEAVIGAPPPTPHLNPMSLSEPGLFAGMLYKAGFEQVVQTTSTYPFSFGSDKTFQLKAGTLPLKEKIDEHGAKGWGKAEAAFWKIVPMYAAVSDSGEMIMPNNTFRLTLARKPM